MTPNSAHSQKALKREYGVRLANGTGERLARYCNSFLRTNNGKERSRKQWGGKIGYKRKHEGTKQRI